MKINRATIVKALAITVLIAGATAKTPAQQTNNTTPTGEQTLTATTTVDTGIAHTETVTVTGETLTR